MLFSFGGIYVISGIYNCVHYFYFADRLHLYLSIYFSNSNYNFVVEDTSCCFHFCAVEAYCSIGTWEDDKSWSNLVRKNFSEEMTGWLYFWVLYALLLPSGFRKIDRYRGRCTGSCPLFLFSGSRIFSFGR